MYCRIIAVLFGILVSGSAGATEEMKTSPMPDWVITSQFDLETPNVAESGDAGAKQLATYFVGQGVGLMNSTQSASSVVYDFMEDYANAVERLSGTIDDT